MPLEAPTSPQKKLPHGVTLHSRTKRPLSSSIFSHVCAPGLFGSWCTTRCGRTSVIWWEKGE
jgi:hypothetical protein